MVRQRVVRPCDAPCVSVGSVLVVAKKPWSVRQITCPRHVSVWWAPCKHLKRRAGRAQLACRQGQRLCQYGLPFHTKSGWLCQVMGVDVLCCWPCRGYSQRVVDLAEICAANWE